LALLPTLRIWKMINASGGLSFSLAKNYIKFPWLWLHIARGWMKGKKKSTSTKTSTIANECGDVQFSVRVVEVGNSTNICAPPLPNPVETTHPRAFTETHHNQHHHKVQFLCQSGCVSKQSMKTTTRLFVWKRGCDPVLQIEQLLTTIAIPSLQTPQIHKTNCHATWLVEHQCFLRTQN
jgi:hypothetical protein